VFNTRRAAQILSSIPSTNQQHSVLNHILMKGSISQLEAHELYKVRRLTSRIDELKKRGVALVAEMRKDLVGDKYARYYIAGNISR